MSVITAPVAFTNYGEVRAVLNKSEYIGYSTDTKPSTPGGVGSTFYELNTGKKWIWDGTYWVEDLSLIYALREALNL